LGDAEKIERIEVRWPSGRTQVLSENLVANKTIVVTEPVE
jgi:hypothetical protein